MSSECFVTYHNAPSEAELHVIEILASLGYGCEFAPGTALFNPDAEGFLLKISGYPSTKPRVRPEREFVVSVGMDNVPDKETPSHRRITFRTTSGRTRLDRDLQFLVAAAVAKLTGGQFYDPQRDARLDGEAAVNYALKEAQTGAPPHDLREREFTGWPA